MDLNNSSTTILVMVFSTLGGFYLPFVYDIVLSSVSSNYRGAACGILEVVISLGSFTGLAIVLAFQPDQRTILLIMSALFLSAKFIQQKGEAHG